MVILRSVPAMILAGAAVILALLARCGRSPRWTAWGSVFSASLLVLPVLAEGGTLYEALAWLLLPVGLMMRRETGQ